ncbi:MAG: Ig-like domain-containing protein [Bacteroidaceae bacterium]|nr:Ig-like domain-containing protein [Bacteroidaceae bacterium]
MKKHLLILASLVLGFGQLFADEVTFSVSDLKASLPASNTNIAIPYAWKTAPYHVTATIAKQDGSEASLGVSTVIALNNTYKVTVSVAGAGTLNSIKFTTNPAGNTANATASTGSYASGKWTPEEGATVSSVTFTCTGNFRLTQIFVDYTPDSGYTPDVPDEGPTEAFEATKVDNLASYTGNDPYVFDNNTQKYYALNTNGEYEEYGVVTEVNTLKVAGNAITEIEYIKSTNDAYINLNYIPKANSKAICTLVAYEGGDWKAAYGCGYYDNGWKDRFCFFTTNATINLGGETGNREAMAYDRKIVTVLDAVAGKMDIFEADGTTKVGTITDSPKTADCKTPLYVFAQNKDNPNAGSTQTDCYNPFIELYGLQLYEGETLVMDLVPAINGEGKGGLKDKLTGTFYGSANNGEFELSPDGQAMAGESGITAYEGKIVIYNGHEYLYWNGEWKDQGAVTYQAVSEIGNEYQNLSNWSYPGSAYDSTFGVNVFDGTTNTLSPYEGKGGWEPLYFKLTGLTKGDSYRTSFIYSGTPWYSWSSYTVLPFFVLDSENMGDNAFNNPSAALGYIELPNTETVNQPYSTIFTANHNYALLCIQFGVVDDGSHPITTDDANQKWKEAYGAFAFSFGDIKVEKRVIPTAYNKIIFADPNKYTPLEYIEAISQVRENPYTLPYNPVTATQIDAKFQVYDTSTGWCGIFSARDKYAGTGISLYMNGNDRAHFGYFTGGTTGSGDNFAPFSLNTEYEVSADVTKLIVNGEEYTTGNTVTNATTRKLSLFSNPEIDNPMRGRFYYCNISEAGEALYNFKPVMRHDGVFGFYDKATQTFVLPAQGKLDGYGYKKLEDQAYVTFTNETRLVIAGNTAQFLPDVQNLDDATFTWTSSDETIATVAADGTVTGVAAGKVTITVTTDADQGWTASYELTVSEPDYKRFDKNNVGYAIVTGGNGWGDSPVAGLVDNDANTKFGCSGTGDAWAIIIASEPVAVQQYSLVTGADTYNYPSRNPVSWKLEGSNDNQTWTLIDEKVQTYQLKSFNKYENTVEVDGTETYKFFKFSVTQIADGFQLSELWINEQAHSFGEEATVLYEPTCTEEGKTAFACSDCGAVNIESVAPLGHDYVDGVCSRCNGKISEVVLLPNRGSDNKPYFAKFRHANGVVDDEYADIEEGWASVDFDDSEWDELMLPLGSFGPYHTRWFGDYNTFWFRRSFNVSNPAEFAKLTFKAAHDDDYAVFINGTKITAEGGWTNGENDFRVVDVDPALLVPGKNVLAMYIEQNWGGAYCDFGLEATLGANVEVTDALYATFVAPCDVDFTEAGVSAFAAQPNGKYVHLEPVTTVPAGTAVVVKAEEAGSYYAPKTSGAVLGTENALIASETPVTADGSQFVLAKPEGEEVGFYRVIENTVINPKTGYLVISGEGVKGFYGFDPDNGTGIKGIDFADENAPIYNVAGQRLQKMQKGINIVGGQKVLK